MFDILFGQVDILKLNQGVLWNVLAALLKRAQSLVSGIYLTALRFKIAFFRITKVTPAGPTFFWAPAYTISYFDQSIGFEQKLLDISQTMIWPCGTIL